MDGVGLVKASLRSLCTPNWNAAKIDKNAANPAIHMYCVGTWKVVLFTGTFFFPSFVVAFLFVALFSASLTAICLNVSNRCLKEGRASDSFSVNSFTISMLAGLNLGSLLIHFSIRLIRG